MVALTVDVVVDGVVEGGVELMDLLSCVLRRRVVDTGVATVVDSDVVRAVRFASWSRSR